MAWVEQRKDSFLVRDRVHGRKVTLASFSDREAAQDEARFYTRNRKFRPITPGNITEVLEEMRGRTGGRRKVGPMFGAYALSVIEADLNIQDTSRDAYRNTILNHVTGSKIDVPIDKIDGELVRRFYNTLEPKKAYARNGDAMRRSVLRVVTKVMIRAVIDGLIPSNPVVAADIKRPSAKRHEEVDPLTIDELEALAAASTEERDRLMILVGGYTGLRGGEVGGLRLQDVDPKACIFHIRKAVKRGKNGLFLGSPKGDKTRRITVPCSLSSEVREVRQEARSEGWPHLPHSERRVVLVS
jgi:integrase